MVPLAVVITAWAAAGIHPAELIRPASVLVLAVLATTVALTVLLGDAHRAGLTTLAFTLAALLPAGPATPLFLGLGCFVFAVGVVSRNTPWRFGPPSTRLLSTLAVVLSIVVAGNSVQRGAWTQAAHELSVRRAAGTVTGLQPNLYVVLLDGYPGDDAATLRPSFDGEWFPDALSARGFEVQRHSRSNYLGTAHTLASMFSMRLLVGEPTDEELRQMVNEGAALDLLSAHGYRITAISSGFGPVDLRSADVFIGSAAPTELEVALMRYTGLGLAIGRVAPDGFAALHRTRILDTFSLLEASAGAPSADGSKFVFAHVPAPHGPWVFGPNGEPRTEGLGAFYSDLPGHRGMDRDEALGRAFDQASYVSKLTVDALDRVRLVDPSAVIVLFSDHGPGTGYNPGNPGASDLFERSSNLLAAYAPGRDRIFPPGTTPVNLFPHLFNRYLGTTIELQPNTNALTAG